MTSQDTPSPHARLRTLAEKAEPDARRREWFVVEQPWLPSNCEPYIVAGSPDPHAGLYVCDFVDAATAGVEDEWSDEEWSSRNWAVAEYIAAANPQVVLGLLDEIDHLQRRYHGALCSVEILDTQAKAAASLEAKLREAEAHINQLESDFNATCVAVCDDAPNGEALKTLHFATVRAEEYRKKLREALDDSAWLIEAAESPVSHPLYWRGSFGDERDHWTDDHLKAVRLARKEDAEAIASGVLNGYAVRIAEHGWSAAASALVTRLARIDTLCGAIAHGDDDHRKWLADAIVAHFAGEPVPAVYGRGKLEARCAQLTADLSAARQNARTWQPIETAPRDGTDFLAWYPEAYQGKGGAFLVLWHHDEFVTLPGLYRHMKFTHWQPLPSPPEIGTASSPQAGEGNNG